MVRILLITDSTKGCFKCRADFMNQSSNIFGGCGVGALPNLGKRAVDDLPEQQHRLTFVSRLKRCCRGLFAPLANAAVHIDCDGQFTSNDY